MKLPFGGRHKPAVVPRRRLSEQPRRGESDMNGAARPAATTFRRNRTLTGSSSESVRPASELTGVIQSPRATAHHLRQTRRRLGVWLLAGLGGAIVMIMLLQQFTAEVRVSIVGQVRPLTSDQQAHMAAPIERYLSTRPLERFRVLLDESMLATYLQAEGLREVEAVTSVRMDGIGQTVIQLKVREPVARWTIGDEQRFVDKNGVVFATNFYEVPPVAIRDESGIAARNEADMQAVTSGRFLTFVGRGVGLLARDGLKITSVVIPADTTRQVHMVIAGKPQLPIKMTIDRPVALQVEDAVRAYRHLAGQGRTAKYLDVRVSGMAYYR